MFSPYSRDGLWSWTGFCMVAFLSCHFGWLFLFPAMPTKWNWNNFRYIYIIMIPGDCMCWCACMNIIGTVNRFCTFEGVWGAVITDNCTRDVISSLNNTVRLCSYCIVYSGYFRGQKIYGFRGWTLDHEYSNEATLPIPLPAVQAATAKI